MPGSAGTAAALGARKLLMIQKQHRQPARRLLAGDTHVTKQWLETWEDNGPDELNPGFFTRHLLQTVRPAAGAHAASTHVQDWAPAVASILMSPSLAWHHLLAQQLLMQPGQSARQMHASPCRLQDT